ncbi:MAG TPA: amidohydrolase [Firmicutes bacterium]|nr:amidohydrolase [Bacillota bacterium]
MSDLLITGGTVITVDEEGQIFDPGVIAVRGDEILYVGPAGGELPPYWKPQRVINAENKLVLPGLVNSHTHAAMVLFRGNGDDLSLQEWLENKIWPLENKLSAEAVYWGTLLAIAEMFLSGITAFADMYFFPDAIARAVAESGIRAAIAPGLLGISPDSATRLREAISFCQEWNGAAGGRVTTMLGPHAPYTCPPEYLAQSLAAARDIEVGIHIHLAETETEIRGIKDQYGVSPVAYLCRQDLSNVHILAAHCVHLEDADIDLLSQNNINVVHNPGSNLKLASGIAPVPRLLTAGIPVALGTDGAASNNNLDILEEARLVALIHKGYTGQPTVIPAEEALKMATANGAAALGLKRKCGRLKAGMKADLILIDRQQPHLYPRFNPLSALIYSARSSDVDTVIVNGEIVVERGELCTLDGEKIMHMAERQARKLLQ